MEEKEIKNKKPPTPKKKKKKSAHTKKIELYEGVECYLTPKVIHFCHNMATNGENKARACRDAGLNKNFVYSPAYKSNKYIPIYIAKIKNDIGEFADEKIEDNSESYVDHIKKYAGKIILKRLVDIVNFRPNRVQKWDNNQLEIFDSETLSIEDMAAIEGVVHETTEYFGKNPRKTTKVQIKVYSAVDAIKQIKDIVGLDFKKDQDQMYVADQLKNMMINQKKSNILPNEPVPETDPALLAQMKEEEEVPLSEVTKH